MEIIIEKSETERSNAFSATQGAAIGAVASTFIIGYLCHEIHIKNKPSGMSAAAEVGLLAATLPLSLLISPVTAPILTVIFAKKGIDRIFGDLTPVSEDEDI